MEAGLFTTIPCEPKTPSVRCDISKNHPKLDNFLDVGSQRIVVKKTASHLFLHHAMHFLLVMNCSLILSQKLFNIIGDLAEKLKPAPSIQTGCSIPK